MPTSAFPDDAGKDAGDQRFSAYKLYGLCGVQYLENHTMSLNEITWFENFKLVVDDPEL